MAVAFNNKPLWLWGLAFAGTASGEDLVSRRHRRRRAHPLHANRRRGIGVSKRIVNGPARGELCGDRADEAIAGACRIDDFDAAAGNKGRLAADKREHAAFAHGDADDFVFCHRQRFGSLDEAVLVVAVMKLGRRQRAELGFIEDQDIDEIEQLTIEFKSGRRIEDGGRTRGAGALEEGNNSGQGNLELRRE